MTKQSESNIPDTEGSGNANTAKLTIVSCIFLISVCGIGYELLAGTISSYFLGNTVLQFSITIGCFLFAMGIGSYISGKIEKNIFDVFIKTELLISIFGGIFTLLLFLFYTLTPDSFYPSFILMILIIGTLIGLEIPLLVRFLKYHSNFKKALASALSVDYTGALVASILFPLFILPYFGIMQTSFIFALINILAIFLFIKTFQEEIKYKQKYIFMAIFIAILLMGGLVYSNKLVSFFENKLFTDEIVYAKQTKYQRIILTKKDNDIRLFLDGNLQFCSIDEYRYHEVLVHPVMSAIPVKDNILVLGGGDGLAVREILKYKDVKNITLVDIDPEMVDLCKTNNLIKNINSGALNSPKLKIVTNDAFKFLETDNQIYDAIFIDLPDPNNESLSKLYTTSFYRMAIKRLSKTGYIVAQATSIYLSPQTFWCIKNTISSCAETTETMSVNVPTFGEWGFVIAGHIKFYPKPVNVEVKYLNDSALVTIFGKAEDFKAIDTNINTIDNPVILQYYEQDWKLWE